MRLRPDCFARYNARSARLINASTSTSTSAAARVVPAGGVPLPVYLSEDEAADLIALAVIEVKKARLRFPYYDDEHPEYDRRHETEFDEVKMGLYEKTIYYVESAFEKGRFDHLLK